MPGQATAAAFAVAEQPPAYGPGQPRLLDRVRNALRTRHLSRRTEQAYVFWIRRYILFHGRRHPSTLGATEVTAFLSALAVERRVAASTQGQALSALLFLYRHVLDVDLPWLDDLVRAKRPVHVPVVLSRAEVAAVLGQLGGSRWLMAALLYGAGLRLLECLHLRVKDVDFERGEIVVRSGKGSRDRRTMLPAVVQEPLAAHLVRVRRQHADDLARGAGWVELPHALDRKYEPSRLSRRLQMLRGWSHGTSDEVCARGAGARGAAGAGARGRARVAVGGDRVDRGEDRLFGGGAAEVGAASRA